MKVLIDNGHGIETPGKRSPDGRLREYLYTRMIADRVVEDLKKSGIEAERIVPEESDIPLRERANRANAEYINNNKQAILISIHCNAMGNGSAWMKAKGWSVFVSPNASGKSHLLAESLARVAESYKVYVRKPLPNQYYWEQSLYICGRTNCPAILVENFFQDNLEDVEFLLSEQGKQCVTDICVNGILKYLSQQ